MMIKRTIGDSPDNNEANTCCCLSVRMHVGNSNLMVTLELSVKEPNVSSLLAIVDDISGFRKPLLMNSLHT